MWQALSAWHRGEPCVLVDAPAGGGDGGRSRSRQNSSGIHDAVYLRCIETEALSFLFDVASNYCALDFFTCVCSSLELQWVYRPENWPWGGDA